MKHRYSDLPLAPPKPRRKPEVRKDGRLVLSPAKWVKMKVRMWGELHATGTPCCYLCGKPIYSYWDFEPDHIIPRGMGGGTRDDSPSNLQPAHSWCNSEKGSKRG